MLKLVVSNNMVQLASQLAERQTRQALPPLEAETVIVQSNELARWLSLFLAEQQGIASHIDFPFPSAYIWQLFRKLLPDTPKQSAFSTDAMTWKIFELLPQCAQQKGFKAIANYFAQQDTPLKRYALAHRIADNFDQYLMYRPDWIEEWQQGQTPHWQAHLWQKLTTNTPQERHRAELLNQLKHYLSSLTTRPENLPTRLSLFGISALPPVYLELFELLAQHCEITLYFLSPSQEYWGDLVSPKSKARQQVEDPEQAAYLSSGHPLLASLGQQGQVFFEQLQNTDIEIEEEYYFPSNQQNTLLQQLQHEIYTLNESQEKHLVEQQDRSIIIHSCHSAMREIEVLHNQLLDLFEHDPELAPTDIVVMTADISLYTPWIEAVFASAPFKQRIPFGIVDTNTQQQNPILTAFASLLDLAHSRFDIEMVMDLLSCPAIQKRFSLDEPQLTLIRRWLKETHTRWGLFAQAKANFDLPETNANTWQAGLDRLLLGYALPLDDEQLFDGKLGFDGISGDRADTLAQLCQFIDCLATFSQRLKAELTTTQWQQQLLNLLDVFFLASTDNPHDETELLLIRSALTSLTETSQLADFKDKITIDLVKEYINTHLESPSNQSRFLGHGVTFCGMVPMRSIPFKVICLIGMNDDSYPRRQDKLSFDLLTTHPRKGDRSRREEDRYLFLESILAAQSQLYISYTGSSISDNSIIPPSVLVSDLRDILRQYFITEDNSDIWQQIFTQHPLQAFSPRNFNLQNPKLFSYDDAICPPEKNTVTNNWFSSPLSEPDAHWLHIDLNQLTQFFQHPSRYLLQKRLGIYLNQHDEQLETREPFELDHLQAWSLRQTLLTAKLQHQNNDAILERLKASGELPQGYMGESIFEQQAYKVDDFAEKLAQAEQDLDPLAFELKLNNFTLTGILNGLSTQGLFSYQMSKVNGKQTLEAWLRHLVLNCLKPNNIICESQHISDDNHYQFQSLSQTDAETYLKQLLDLYWQGLQQPLPLFDKTSYAFAKASLKGNKTDTAMNKAWDGDQYQGESEDPYHQQLYANSPLDDDFKALALTVYEPIQAHLLDGKL